MRSTIGPSRSFRRTRTDSPWSRTGRHRPRRRPAGWCSSSTREPARRSGPRTDGAHAHVPLMLPPPGRGVDLEPDRIPMLNERGFSLMEALTGATITVIAVLGLAYSFGVGRGLVNRYEVARAALGEAQSELEALHLLPMGDPAMAIGYASPPTPFRYEGITFGTS